MNYFDVWRAIKCLNFRTFIIDAKEIEVVI